MNGAYSAAMSYAIRPVSYYETPSLEMLIAASARGLSGDDYTSEEIETAIRYIFGVDSELVEDGTYFAVVDETGAYMACGGWSKRRTLFGGDHYAGRKSGLLDPSKDAAKIRAFFVHPDHARKGVGKALLQHCEAEALKHGFTEAELMATLPGVKLYARYGYVGTEVQKFKQLNGVEVPFVPMRKTLI